MRKKGFTLIELLAVIVILAIIALIATPIVIDIIKSTKEEANLRSAENYLKAARLAIARQSLTDSQNYSTCAVLSTGNMSCDGVEIKVDMENSTATGGVLMFADGKLINVSGLEINNQIYNMDTEGKLVSTDTPVPVRVYYTGANGNIGESVPNAVEDTASSFVNINNSFYIKLEARNNIVEKAYVCFVRFGTEYCVKGNDADAYDDNVRELERAYETVISTACSFEPTSARCTSIDDPAFLDPPVVMVSSDGIIDVVRSTCGCYINGSNYRCAAFAAEPMPDVPEPRPPRS